MKEALFVIIWFVSQNAAQQAFQVKSGINNASFITSTPIEYTHRNVSITELKKLLRQRHCRSVTTCKKFGKHLNIFIFPRKGKLLSKASASCAFPVLSVFVKKRTEFLVSTESLVGASLRLFLERCEL